MASYKKREMNRREYLVHMGAVFLKSLRELSKRGINEPKNKAPVRRPAFLLHPHFLYMSEIHRGPLGLLLKLKSSSRIIFSGVRIIYGCF